MMHKSDTPRRTVCGFSIYSYGTKKETTDHWESVDCKNCLNARKAYEILCLTHVAAFEGGESVAQLVNLLPYQERGVLILRLGLDGQPPRTLRGVGEMIPSQARNAGISKERVRQIEARALRMLRHSSFGPLRHELFFSNHEKVVSLRDALIGRVCIVCKAVTYEGRDLCEFHWMRAPKPVRKKVESMMRKLRAPLGKRPC